MKERFKTLTAVMLMLLRETATGQEILLQKRKNTGFCDGFYDFSASGHVDEGESMKRAMCREAYEELGIRISPDDLEFVCLIHKNIGNGTYCNVYFKALRWEGDAIVNEPEKNEELRWFSVHELPENIVNDRKTAVENYLHGVHYSQYGWFDER